MYFYAPNTVALGMALKYSSLEQLDFESPRVYAQCHYHTMIMKFLLDLKCLGN